jgi:hypothetical protein
LASALGARKTRAKPPSFRSVPSSFFFSSECAREGLEALGTNPLPKLAVLFCPQLLHLTSTGHYPEPHGKRCVKTLFCDMSSGGRLRKVGFSDNVNRLSTQIVVHQEPRDARRIILERDSR